MQSIKPKNEQQLPFCDEIMIRQKEQKPKKNEFWEMVKNRTTRKRFLNTPHTFVDINGCKLFFRGPKNEMGQPKSLRVLETEKLIKNEEKFVWSTEGNTLSVGVSNCDYQLTIRVFIK